jgi:monoterpene epsilon-lactone hydrolase
MASEKYYAFMDALRAQPPSGDLTISEERANFERVCSRDNSGGDAIVEAVNADDVPAEWSTPPGVDAERVIFYLHGGGYQMGSPLTHRGLVGRIARAASARALSIDYRLAPEHRFPVALEDSVAAYRWLRRQGIRADRITLAGDSAGGGLALATMVAVRDSGDALPAAAVCMSPLTDLAMEGASMRTCAALDPFIRPEDIAAYSHRYLGPDGDPKAPLASPLYADLRGLPPILMLVGTWEVLLDDSTRLAERARDAGVEVELQLGEEMVHVWPSFAPLFPEAAQAIQLIGDYIRKRTGG